jgi:hypothetical protein
LRKLIFSLFAVTFLLASAPSFAGIHYKATQKSDSDGPRARSTDAEVEGWVSGDKAKVVFVASNGNPMAQAGTYILTKDGGKTLYLVNPQDKTYAQWSIEGMLGVVGAMMNGMGPLLKIQFSDPKVEKLADDDGGPVDGLPTRHSKFRTSYVSTVKVLGMGNTTNVTSDQEVWTTTALGDPGLGVWLRAEPPRTGNEDFDKLIAAQSGRRYQGIPLKVVTVHTSTAQKGNRSTTTHSTLEVTQIDTKASVPAATFEIPADYKETQIAPTQQGGNR